LTPAFGMTQFTMIPPIGMSKASTHEMNLSTTAIGRARGMVMKKKAVVSGFVRSLLASLFIAVYLLGSLKNRRLMRDYAEAMKEELEPRVGRVKFRLTSRGFEAICYPRHPNLEWMTLRVMMADRWNLVHYLLIPITHDADRILITLKGRLPKEMRLRIVWGRSLEGPLHRRGDAG